MDQPPLPPILGSVARREPGWPPPPRGPAVPDRRVGCLLRALGCLPMLFGAMFILGAFVWADFTTAPADWPRTQGAISEIRSSMSMTNFQGTTFVYLASVEYKVSGGSYEIETSGQSSVAPTVGQLMTVAYDANSPATARVVEGNGQSQNAMFFGLVGSIAAAAGVIWLLVGPIRIAAAVGRLLSLLETR